MSHAKQPLLHVAEDHGSGSPVVLLHGIASSSVTFKNVIPLVAPRHRCIAVDLLGFGQSPIPETGDYTVEEHAHAIQHTLATLHIRGPIILVGHSMGALIAARLAARHPRQFGKLVLVSPPIYLAPSELAGTRDRKQMDFYRRAYEYVRANQRFTLRAAHALEGMLSIPQAMDINERTWIPFVRSLEHSIESQTTVSDLASISAPVDIVYGNFDEFHSDGVMKIVSRLAGVRMHRVIGTDHLVGKRLARAVAAAIAS